MNPAPVGPHDELLDAGRCKREYDFHGWRKNSHPGFMYYQLSQQDLKGEEGKEVTKGLTLEGDWIVLLWGVRGQGRALDKVHGPWVPPLLIEIRMSEDQCITCGIRGHTYANLFK